MTDTDIIKALGCLSGNVIFCADCGYTNDGRCKERVAKDALDLINRQKAEIEKKQIAFENLLETTKYWKGKCDELVEELETARAEAIREFAERLKPKLRKNARVSPFASNLNDVIIDNLIKEMTEG